MVNWYVLDEFKLWPDDGARWKVKGSPKLLQFILKGRWTRVPNFMATHPTADSSWCFSSHIGDFLLLYTNTVTKLKRHAQKRGCFTDFFLRGGLTKLVLATFYYYYGDLLWLHQLSVFGCYTPFIMVLWDCSLTDPWLITVYALLGLVGHLFSMHRLSHWSIFSYKTIFGKASFLLVFLY